MTKKDDSSKPPIFRGVLDLFPRAIEAVASVSQYGASKYSWTNWKTVDNGINRYTDAMMRHLSKESKGEFTDVETELSHASSVAWNAIARLELILLEMENKE